jgi:opacity protein-like surface antigen
MLGSRLRIAAWLALVTLTSVTAAAAADYSPPPPPVIIQSPQECCSNWYLRGDVGIGMNAAYDLQYLPNAANVGNGFAFEHSDFSDAFIIGFGGGYYFNNWLRVDATGEYRSKARVYASGVYDQITGQGDAYQGYLNSWVFLANAYVDLGTWNCFTPFVGFGVGGAYNTLADFVDTGVGQTGRGYGRNSSEWNLAWAVHAGVAYNVSKNLKIELSYRYLNYGSITDTVDCVGGCNADSYKFDNLHSSDIRLGLRFTCCELPGESREVYAPPPPVYQAPPAYQPPPVYQPAPGYQPSPGYQPPLRSRG